MTDNSNDAVRQHVDQLRDTPASAGTKDRPAGSGRELRPDWMRDQADKGQASDRGDRGTKTKSEKEGVGSDR
jgi:hypothetical protein